MKIKLKIPESIPGPGVYRVIRELVQIADPEKILLLSASYDYRFTENIFIKNPEWECRGSRYQVLLLVDSAEKKSRANLERQIHDQLAEYKDLRIQIMDNQIFNRQVGEGDEWSCFVHFNAMILYEK